MAESGAGGASSLVEVARVLVQQGRQYGTSDHDVGKTIGGDCAKTLSICFPALTIVWSISSLLGTGYKQHSRSRNWIYGHLQSELELHLWCQWRWIVLIGNVKIRNNSEHTLLFFGLELFVSNFDWVVMNIDSDAIDWNSQLDAGHNSE